MENIKVQYANEYSQEDNGDFSMKDALELKKLLSKFMREYGEKPAGQSDEEWLKLEFLAEIPELSEEEAISLSRDTVESIREYDSNLASLLQEREHGKTAEEWFSKRSQEAAVGISAEEFSKQMVELDAVLSDANRKMLSTVQKLDGTINQNPSLNGFIAEQQHVNTFNIAAEASDSPYRAYVLTPEPGATYNKNSFDVVIKDQGGKIVHQYQLKYGQDAKHTIALIKSGNYNNQTLVVPAEQVEEVQAAFPGKTVVSHIGGTEKVPISSEPLSKENALKMQEEAQQFGIAPELDWNAYDSQMLAKYVGKRAAIAGLQGAAIATGFHLAAKLVADEPIDAEEVVTTALKTGADSGIKSVAAGAVKVASERGLIKVIPKGTSMGAIVNVVCVAIENVKILMRVANGEITMGEALDLMGCNTVAMTFGLKWGTAGIGVGIVALSWIPVVGPVIGGVVGGLVGYMAGSKMGETVYQTAKKIAEVAKNTVKRIWETGKETIKNGALWVRETLFGWL